jgi:hypothetical protein
VKVVCVCVRQSVCLCVGESVCASERERERERERKREMVCVWWKLCVRQGVGGGGLVLKGQTRPGVAKSVSP